MTTNALRKKVHSYIDGVEPNVLEAIYSMLKIYVDDDGKSLMSSKQKAEVEKRSNEYRKGNAKTFSWEQVKRNTRSHK
jgi:hypothetical protein